MKPIDFLNKRWIWQWEGHTSNLNKMPYKCKYIPVLSIETFDDLVAKGPDWTDHKIILLASISCSFATLFEFHNWPPKLNQSTGGIMTKKWRNMQSNYVHDNCAYQWGKSWIYIV